jgi:hypothetical protein
MTVSHLDMFYNTRGAVHVTDSDPSNNPNTSLTRVPKAAEIRFADNPDQFIDAEEFEAPNGKGFETARFLIGRAMLDPDATVVPTGK